MLSSFGGAVHVDAPPTSLTQIVPENANLYELPGHA
jgi:hypothetical protein